MWLSIALVWALQVSVGATLLGQQQPFGKILRAALIESVPWIPVTFAIMIFTTKLPLTRERWKQRLPVHVASALSLAFVANALLALEYALMTHSFVGLSVLMQNAAKWAGVRLAIALLIYAIVAGLTQTLLYYRDTRDRELQLARVQGQLARARMEALNAQIRPHFLFNTLHTIGQLWRAGRSDDAETVLDRLGSLFHKVQDATSEIEVPLSEELDVVRDYLAIEQTRFSDRMHAEICAGEDTLDLLVPPLILQPVVENAVRHGISRLSSAGQLRVEARRTHETLTLRVSDDGPGFSSVSDARGSGTGLRNTRERLLQLYGNAAKLEIEDNVPTGTIIRITLPAHDS